jgi:hypothetical protein
VAVVKCIGMQDVEWNLRLPSSGRVVRVCKDEEPEGEDSGQGESDSGENTGEEAREGEGKAGKGEGSSGGVKVAGAVERWWEDEEEWGVCVFVCVCVCV